MNCLEKSQINDFIKNPENISVCKYYMKSIFGNSFSKNITLAKSIIRDWPNKDTCSVIDFDYLIHHNYEFKKFLTNYKSITIHEGDFKGLPATLRNNKFLFKMLLMEVGIL